MSLKEIPLEKFIGSPNNILDLLYQEPEQTIDARTLEQFLNLPLNENYVRNQKLKMDNTNIQTNTQSDR